MTAIQVTELSLDLTTAAAQIERRSDVGSNRVQFTEQQSRFIKEALEWLAFPQNGQKLMALHGFAGSGKRQPLTEPVLTPDGWRVMGDISVGSYVIGADGHPAKVTGVYPGSNKTYKVTFCDGTFAYCCDEHLWKVQTPKQRAWPNGGSKVIALKEMLPRIGHRNTSRNYYYSVPLCEAVQFEEQSYDLDPYLMGWLLAEACMSGPQIGTSVHVDEVENIATKISSLLPKGIEFRQGKVYQGNACQVRFTKGLQPYLNSLGLMGKLSADKFIPKSYLLGSEQQRKDLLAGLLDGDGTTQSFSSGKVKTAFHSASEEMACGVAELVRSLGGYACVSKMKERGKGEEWRVSVRVWFNPFSLPYKRDKYGDYIPKMKRHKKIVSAEYVGVMPGQCIAVDNEDHLYLTRDYIVTHNTYTVNHLLAMARQSGLLVGDVWATAPTHQAKKILEQASKGTGSGITQFMTSHSFFGLRPQKVTFEAHHEDKLEELTAIDEQYRTPDQNSTIDSLVWRKNASFEGLEEFLPTKLKKGAEHVRLVVVDEFSMINKVLANLYFELPYLYDMHPDLQVLFLGDPAQLPPIKEKESLIADVPKFTPLTEVVRNDGNILAYCTEVRTAPEDRLASLHYKYDSDDLMLMTQQEVLRSIKEVMDSGDSVRFIAGTNERCREINEIVRYALKGVDSGLQYQTGDTVLTLSAVKRGIAYSKRGQSNYGPKCDGSMQDHTSTLFELGDELSVGDYVGCGDDGGMRLTADSFAFTTVSGTTFNRKFFRYRPYDSGDEFTRNDALCLVDPAQYDKWEKECAALWTRAKTTQTSSKKKGARGQLGDGAKAVWAELGIKNWHKKLDGSDLSYDEYKKMRSQLWVDAFLLRQFSDKASFSYCATCHRSQGVTTDVAVIDERTLIKTQMGKYSEHFDLRKLIYTAASRARKQLIVMV